MLDDLLGGTTVTGVYGEEIIQGTNFNGPGWEDLDNEQRQEIQRTRTEAWAEGWSEEWEQRPRAIKEPAAHHHAAE